MNDPILIDECLSRDLAALANARLRRTAPVVFRGLQGTLDADLMPVIREGNPVLPIAMKRRAISTGPRDSQLAKGAFHATLC